MKNREHYFAILFFFTVNFSTLGQIKGTYTWLDQAVLLKSCDFSGNVDNSPTVVLNEPKQEFIVVNSTQTHAVIKILEYSYPNNQGNASLNSVTDKFYLYNFRGTESDYDSLSPQRKNNKNYPLFQYYYRVSITDIQSKAGRINPRPSFQQSTVKPPVVKALDGDYNDTYRWKKPVQMIECDKSGNIRSSGIIESSRQYQRFTVEGNKGDSIVLRVWDYSKTKTIADLSKATKINRLRYNIGRWNIFNITNYYGVEFDTLINTDFEKYNFRNGTITIDSFALKTPQKIIPKDNQKYFLVDKDKLTNLAEKHHKIGASMEFGLLSLPFRLRLQPNRKDFTGTFNLSGAIGMSIPHYNWRKWKFSFLTAYGISSVTLDASTVTSNQALLETANSFNAFTFAFGPMVQYNNVQAGLFIGMDRINHQNQKSFGWKYQGNTWFSIGFGYSIFSIEKESSNATQTNQSKR